ncbi:ABC transporter, permease protein [Leuconostoc citreum LBAE C11]|nr:ABC transporter, permease protein [Leuconostoc citreum LBAE C11]
MSMIVSSIGQGLLWAVLGVALFLTFRILDFPDMTVEGSFPLGAATTVAMIAHGINPYLATIAAFLVGAVAGLITGLLYTKGRIPILLAGILVMTAALSINLRIMGSANISLLNQKSIFSANFLQHLPKYFDAIFVGFIIITIITLALIFSYKQILVKHLLLLETTQRWHNQLGLKRIV